MFAEKKEDVVSSEYYEIFTVEKVKDIDGNDVDIPRSLGQYSLVELENQKNSFLAEVAKLDEKIDIIKAL